MPYLPIQRILKIEERRALWVFGEVQNEPSPCAIQSTTEDLNQLKRGGTHSRNMLVLIVDGKTVSNNYIFERVMQAQESLFPFVWECAPATVTYGLNIDTNNWYKTQDGGNIMIDNTRRYVSSGDTPYFIATADFPYLWAFNGKSAYLIGRNGTEELK